MKKHSILMLALLVSGFFMSCSESHDEEEVPELKNHIEVGENFYEDIHMMLAYTKDQSKMGETSYPLRIYLYEGDIAYSDVEGLIENAFANIRLDLQVSQNGKIDAGTYTWDIEGSTALSIRDAQHLTNQVGTQIITNTGISNVLYNKFEGNGIREPELSIKILDENLYEFHLKASDMTGHKVSAYYKGGVSRTMLYGESANE
ncbi:hypothetical protein [Marinifilum fragile]|uniref:hypothetical protein n=1 Tax=Marinifilum fragile TaxID=570161 RepID=UPI002AA614C6|nr:hypothetical protein [Marinifilum fragile]